MDGDDFNFDGIALTYYCWLKKNYPNLLVQADQEGDYALPSSTVYGEYWTEFCKEHGVKVEVTPEYHGSDSARWTYEKDLLKVTPKNWGQMAKGGTIEVNVNWVDLIDPNTGQHVIPTSNGAHAMDVVGVTTNGYFIVSSWGKEYYLDPNNGSVRDFIKISYK
jgi:hypothetical protein